MATGLKECSVCGERFLVKYRSQIERGDDGISYYCSDACRQENRDEKGEVVCSVCDTEFTPKYAYQKGDKNGDPVYFCSMDCRQPSVKQYRRKVNKNQKGPMRVAILNQKGGTGKTTTTVSLAAGLADEGYRVLLFDVDSQGHVGISLGVEGERTLHDILVKDHPVENCIVAARPNLDIVVGDESLASAEIYLARLDNEPNKQLRQKLRGDMTEYDFILFDCGPSLSLLNMNALTFADHLLVPVACDFLSLVGVKQVMKTLKDVNRRLMHPIDIMGILPTFYDMRNNISDESVKTLKGHFHDKVLPPIRVNTRIKEAPQKEKTIFEYAPSSRGAQDYERLVDWMIEQQESRLAS